MPCILTLHIRAGPSDGLWVSWSHHEQSGEERSEGGAPSVGERSSEMVTNATNCRDCQPLMDLQRWETSDSFVITDGPRWAVLWKFYLNHDNYNELLTHQVSLCGRLMTNRRHLFKVIHAFSWPALMIEHRSIYGGICLRTIKIPKQDKILISIISSNKSHIIHNWIFRQIMYLFWKMGFRCCNSRGGLKSN